MSEGNQSQDNFYLLKNNNSNNNLPLSNILSSKNEKIELNNSQMNKSASLLNNSNNPLNFNIFANVNMALMENYDKEEQKFDLLKKISKDPINNNENNNENTVIVNNGINHNIENNNIYNSINNNESLSNNNNNSQNNYMNNSIINNNNNNINNQKSSNENTTVVIKNNLQINKNYLEDEPNIEKTRLSDLGKKSYLNSVLQCLVNIKELNQYFLNNSNTKNIYENIKEKRLSFAIQRLFYHCMIKQDKKYLPDSILDELSRKNIIFKQNHLEINPKYCLNFILEQLHCELNANKGNSNNLMFYNQYNEQDVINLGKSNFEKMNNSIISNTFSWYYLKEYQCNICKTKKFNFESFYTFELDIQQYYNLTKKNQIRLYDCLNYSCLYLPNSNSYCDSCKSYCNTSKFLRIINSPKILIFIIDRGNFDNNLLNLNFIIDSEINLMPYLHYKEKNVKYELTSIISVFGNKFISLIKADEDYWYLFNDSNVHKVENFNLFNINCNTGVKQIPCILFYKLAKNHDLNF